MGEAVRNETEHVVLKFLPWRTSEEFCFILEWEGNKEGEEYMLHNQTCVLLVFKKSLWLQEREKTGEERPT